MFTDTLHTFTDTLHLVVSFSQHFLQSRLLVLKVRRDDESGFADCAALPF